MGWPVAADIGPPKPKFKCKIPRVVTIDLESFGIEGRPDYPPVPVGVSIKIGAKKARYYAWGHVPFKGNKGGNNCTKVEAIAALKAVWNNPDGLLMQHSKFDLDLFETHLGLKMPPWQRIHELMFLLFLHNPNALRLDLKSSAHRLLGMPPEEQDVVKDWLITNQPIEGVKIGTGVKSKEPFGKYIAYCPGDIVGPYANGDVDRTYGLFAMLYPLIAEPREGHPRGMLPAYDRERKLIPILLDMERRGIRVDLRRLRSDVKLYDGLIEKLSLWVCDRLDVPTDFNLDADAQLLNALARKKLVNVKLMGKTPKGRTKMDKGAIDLGVTDKVLGGVLKYLTQLKTCVRNFLGPWLTTAEKSGGFIFTNWNQTRGAAGGGARTGRFSSSPNFQNIPKEFGMIFRHEAEAWNAKCAEKDRVDLAKYPVSPFDLPALPFCRSYIVPMDKNHVMIGRDYSQQEPRIMAHFEGATLMDQYNANPWIDYHDNAKANLDRMFNSNFPRKKVKIINLGLIYGQGTKSLAIALGEPEEDVKQLKKAILSVYPGLDDMYNDMRARAQGKEPVTTWGGRVFYCEPPRRVELTDDNGDTYMKTITFDYKMVNYLVQGSAADCTKEAMIRIVIRIGEMATGEESKINDPIRRGLAVMAKMGWYMILQVHDEIVMSVPACDMVAAQEVMRAAMESVEFDVLILSEGAWSPDNWHAMQNYDVKGKRLTGRLPRQKALT